jgi:hypothetical protein
MKIRLVYLIFGKNIQNHFQANFSIISFLSQGKDLIDGITVITDAPDFYQRIAERVDIEEISSKTLKDWEGEFDFFWRVKIKALEHVAQQHQDRHLIYLDSDTFLYGSLDQLSQNLATGVAFMHEIEGALSKLTSKTERRMWQQIKGKTFGGITMHERNIMYNAGVVAIPAVHNLEAITLALRICDDLCAQKVTPRLIEQFALSVALTETYVMQQARAHIGHYWSTKDEWNGVIMAFLLESHLENCTVEDEILSLEKFNFNSLPIKKKTRNTQHRLNKLINKFFPPKNVEYL